MTPSELSELHPRLFHVTTRGAAEAIRRDGLMSTRRLLEFLGVPEDRLLELTSTRRKTAIRVPDERGNHVIGDNAPLSEKRLQGRLEDGLTFSEWLRILNDRVFFWTDPARATSLRRSRLNKDLGKELITLETRRLAEVHQSRMEIAPFNTGSTGRQPRPPTRGRATFAPLLTTDYAAWRRRRGQRDKIVEVVVRDEVPDVADFIIDVQPI